MAGPTFADSFKFWDNLCRDSAGIEKCGGCKEDVRAIGKVFCLDRVWHQSCFKCSRCPKRLSPTSYYCTNHTLYCYECYRQKLTGFPPSRASKVDSFRESREDSTLDELRNLSLESSPRRVPALNFGYRSQTNDDQRRRVISDLRDSPFGTCRFSEFIPTAEYATTKSSDQVSSRDFSKDSTLSRETVAERRYRVCYGNGSGVKPKQEDDNKKTVTPSPPEPAVRRRFTTMLDNVTLEWPKTGTLSVRQMADKVNHSETGGVIGLNTHHFCGGCNKTVHPAQQKKCLGRIWHLDCIRCFKCGKRLETSSNGYYDFSIKLNLFCEGCYHHELSKVAPSARRWTVGGTNVEVADETLDGTG